MQRLGNFIIAIIVSAGIITVWVIVPFLILIAGSGFLLLAVYYIAQDYREEQKRLKVNKVE